MTNWRTSVFGTLTLLAAFITQFPELLDAVIDPALAKKIAAGCALATGFLTFANSKDRQVTGNGTIDFPSRVPDAETDGCYSRKIPPAAFLLALCSAALLTGCAGMDRYDRTYSVSYEDAAGRKIGTGATFHPRDGKEMLKPLGAAGMFPVWVAETRRMSRLNPWPRTATPDPEDGDTYEELHTVSDAGMRRMEASWARSQFGPQHAP